MKCVFCGRDEDLRGGLCFDCAEAQNILAVGKDMLEDEDGKEYQVPVKVVNERLKKLIAYGWEKSNPKAKKA